jgi:hypothetical protein
MIVFSSFFNKLLDEQRRRSKGCNLAGAAARTQARGHRSQAARLRLERAFLQILQGGQKWSGRLES